MLHIYFGTTKCVRYTISYHSINSNKNSGATVAYSGGNLTVAVILATTRSNKENIRIWKEYANVMREEK